MTQNRSAAELAVKIEQRMQADLFQCDGVVVRGSGRVGGQVAHSQCHICVGSEVYPEAPFLGIDLEYRDISFTLAFLEHEMFTERGSAVQALQQRAAIIREVHDADNFD